MLILTFDEDDNLSGNHIPTFVFGPMVQKGSYSNHVDTYSFLRMIEDIYGTSHAANASTATPIDYCWKCPTQSVITAGGPITFCAPATVTLSGSTGSSYL